MALPWINATDKMVGKGHATLTDTLNAALRTLLQKIGIDPDVPFAGLRGKVFNPMAYDAVGDGATDDHDALFNANAAAVGSVLHLPAGKTFKVGSNLTIDANVLDVDSGATLKPSLGVTITITGNIRAEQYRIFDLSLGGSVDLQSNKHIRAVKAFWFGIVADGATDDSAALNAMTNSLRWYQKVEFPSGGYTIALAHPWLVLSKEGVTFTTGTNPLQGDRNGGAVLKWIGNAGGRMVIADRCRYCTWSGFIWNGNGLADIGLDMDGYGGIGAVASTGAIGIAAGTWTVTNTVADDWQDTITDLSSYVPGRPITIPGAGPGGTDYKGYVLTLSADKKTLTLDPSFPAAATTVAAGSCTVGDTLGGIGTGCNVEYSVFFALSNRKTWRGIRLSHTVTNNWEFCKFRHLMFNGPGETNPRWGTASVTAGSPNVTLTSNNFRTSGLDIDATIFIAGAGVGGETLQAKVVSVTDVTHAVLDTNASATLGAAAMVIQNGHGYGIEIGASPNAKSEIIDHCVFIAMEHGVHNNGTAHLSHCDFENNIVNHWDAGGADPGSDYGSNSEFSLQHLVFGPGGGMLKLDAIRTDVENTPPGCGHFHTISGAMVKIGVVKLENPFLSPSAYAFHFESANNTIDTLFTPDTKPWASLFKPPTDPGNGGPYPALRIAAMINVSSVPASIVENGTRAILNNGQSTEAAAWLATLAADQPKWAGGQSSIAAGPHAQFGAELIAHRFRTNYGFGAGYNDGHTGGYIFGGATFEPPSTTTDQAGATIAETYGGKATSPKLVNGHITKASGFIVDPQGVSGIVVNPRGFDAKGARDISFLAGGAVVGAVEHPAPAATLDIYGGIRARGPIATPSIAPTVTPQGTPGGSGYTYYVVAVDAAGVQTPPSPVGSTAIGNAILSAANFNRVTWPHIEGAAYYILLRNGTGNAIGSAGSKIIPTPDSATVTYDDIGLGTDGYAPAPTNETGKSQIDGPTALGSRVAYKTLSQTIAAAGSYAPDVASAGTVLRLTLSGATATLNNPTNPVDGTILELEVLNSSGGASALTFGSAFLGTFTVGANTKWRTQAYRYDGTISKWKPLGAQSGDL